MSGDPAGRTERLAYLADCVDLLWPGAAARHRVVLPAARVPRLLVPVRPRRAGAAALVRYTAQQGTRERAVGLAAAGAVRLGLGGFLPEAAPTAGRSDTADGETVDDLLARVLGEPVAAALPLTPARANRKPVLQVFDARGRTLAFAKVGVSPLARELVADEARALLTLAGLGLTHLDVPHVVHHGTWRDTTVLVTTALPMSRRVPTGSPLLAAAMRELAGHGTPDAARAYVATLHERAAALPDGTDRWTAVVHELTDGAPLEELPTGYWHGDWTAWNCGSARGRLVVWDWERLGGPAPRGFDALHHALNQAPDRGAAAWPLVERAPDLLRAWGPTAAQARLVAGLYLLDVALRYVADANGTGVEAWAVPAVRAARRPAARTRPEERGVTTR